MLFILIQMRSSKNLRLLTSDLKRIQKSIKEKTDKEVESLIQLIDLPDFDISEFFQTLLKSPNYQEVLDKIPKEKQIDFFSRNFQTFIETQQELAQIKLPVLDQIPKAKKFHFQETVEIKAEENLEESSVTEIVDSFSTSVLEKNNEEIKRMLQIIKEMKQHTKYQKYFNIFSISQIYREAYQTFVETCEDLDFLISINEGAVAMKKFIRERMLNFIAKIRTDVNIDNTNRGVKKVMNSLLAFIEATLKEVKQKFPIDEKSLNVYEADTIIPRFLQILVKEFYQTIEPCIYEKQQLVEVLEALQIVLESATELESKGINLSIDLRNLVSHDLPAHMNKIVEVVIEAFDDILKQDNQLYEFKYFDGVNCLAEEIALLAPIKQGQYGKKCCSQKGILLINSFAIILEPLCNEKWQFLHESVIEQLLDKVLGAIYQSNWNYWDYYQLFHFFDKMKSGRIKNKKLFIGEEPPNYLKQKINSIKKISLECWQLFENKVTNTLWQQILMKIPDLLWEIRPYVQAKTPTSMKPTVFSLDLTFMMENFLKNIEFRLQRLQFEHLITRFYEYVMYVVEYVIYWSYHKKGTKDKVFSLYKRSERIMKKAKMFSIEQLPIFKEEKRILLIQMFTGYGVQNFALDLYYFTEAMKIMTDYQKFNCEPFVEKISQIQAKQHKTEPVNIAKVNFDEGLSKFIKIFQQEPQKIRDYIESKRKPESEVKKRISIK